MTPDLLPLRDTSPRILVGVGGIGSGTFFALEGDHTLGRNESRPARLLDVRDYCKLHIISHYVAVLLGAGSGQDGFRVFPLGRVGSDAAGERLRVEMAAAGMDLSHVESVANAVTLHSVCFQYPDGSGGNITTSNGAASLLGEDDIVPARALLESAGGRAMVLAAPEVPLLPRRGLLAAGRDCGAFNVAAFTTAEIGEAVQMDILKWVDLVALNEDEAAALAGRPFSADSGFRDDLIGVLREFNPGIQVVVSAGAAGAWAFADGRWQHAAVVPVAPVSTAGAGDALLGGVMAALAAGVPLVDTVDAVDADSGQRGFSCALDFGVLLASLSVTSPHTIHPDANLSLLKRFATDFNVVFDGPLAEVLN